MKSLILIFSFYFHLLFATSHSRLFQVFQETIKTWFNFGISSILVTTVVNGFAEFERERK